MNILYAVFITFLLATQAESREIYLIRNGNHSEFSHNKELMREFAQNKDKKLTGSILGLRGYAQVKLGELICSGRFFISENGDLWIVYLQSVLKIGKDGRIQFYWTSVNGIIYAESQ